VFYEWLYPLHNVHGLSFLNLFKYITVRSALAAVLALLISFLLGPPMIGWLRRVKLGQKVREEGPQSHYVKAGTPTMGGLLMLCAIGVPVLLCGNFHNRQVWLALLTTLWLGGLGFLDDWLRVVKKLPKGLLGRYKLLGQFSIGAIVAACVLVWPEPNASPTLTHVPFLKSYYFDLGLLFVPFVMLVITGASNAVNLTDGLDGLAMGPVIVAAMAFGLIAYVTGNARLSEYLFVLKVKGVGELTVVAGALVGASIGFLWFNSHPAEVFMGDVGSLALGGALGTLAVLAKVELLLPFIGGLFVVEAVSVILQVASFRTTGRRIFRMAPLHHHFELAGWPESKIVIRFWILSLLMALMAVTTLKLR